MPALSAQLALDLSGIAALQSVTAQRAVTMAGVKAAARVVSRAVKPLAPKRKGGGGLRVSIGVKTVKGRKAGVALAVVGARKKTVRMVVPPRGKRPVKSVPAYYAHLVEFGTKPHSLTKGASVGRGGKGAKGQGPRMHPGAQARPFLRPAWAACATAAIAAGMAAITAALDKAMKRQAAKLGKVK